MSKTGAKLTLVSLSVFAVGVLIFMLYRKKKEMTGNTEKNDMDDTENNGYYTDKNSLAAINHNPGNIVKSTSQWQGKTDTPARLIEENRSTRFEAFKNDYYGVRAAVINLLNGYFKKGYDTPAKIIGKWAPASDGNNTDNYTAYVAKSMGIDKNARIDHTDKEQMFLLIRAICVQESGFLGDKIIQKAINDNV